MPDPIQLRPYQVEAVEALRAAYKAGSKAPILVMPTGAGKTLAFSYITQGAAARGNRTLILAHRRELITQASNKLSAFGVEHALCMPGHGASASRTVVVGSVQTVVRRLDRLGEFQLIILDEAHHARASSYATILAAQPRARLLGCTATPCRLDGSGLGAHCGGFFDAIVEGPSMAELTAQGYLAPLKIFAPKLNGLTQGVKLRVRAGEFAKEDDAALMDRPTITGDTISQYRKYADGLQTITFCCTVDHARNVAAGFAAAGIPSESIDGSLKTFERNAVLDRFATKRTRVMTSCELVSEGFDAPEAACAIMLRHTASLTVYRQQAGRIMRPAPDKIAVLIDPVGNTNRHFPPDWPVEWDLNGKPKRAPAEATGGDPWQCSGCLRVCYPHERKCPDCGTEKPREKRELPRVVAGDLREVQRPWQKMGLSYEEYAAVVLNRERQRQAEDKEYFTRIARERGYKDGWVYYRVQARHQARLAAAMSGQAKIISQ